MVNFFCNRFIGTDCWEEKECYNARIVATKPQLNWACYCECREAKAKESNKRFVCLRIKNQRPFIFDTKKANGLSQCVIKCEIAGLRRLNSSKE